ncbi:hypothetical protein [Pseudanabaena sp. lw0831]|uniref:hypothetical protein n=1 Tax=Pseudanabaena sp. lw0831 TaxID=1357935 RepID=UPI001915D6C7|nr:hypothetical protein [Pseudanabaena sp. lw0831]
MAEFKILAYIIDSMEANGVTSQVVKFEVDQKFANEISSKYGIRYTVSDLKKAVDKCLANEWLAQRSFEKYKDIGITPKGVGAARSKIKSEENKSSQTIIKKASDYIEEHKGLFVFFGFLIALATFASKFFGVTK